MNMDFAALSLEEDDDAGFEVEERLGEDARKSVEFCLIGTILTDKIIHFLSFKDRMASIWRPGKGVTIQEWRTGIFIFQFYHELDMKRVTEGGPWSFDNNLLILRVLKEGEDPNMIELKEVEFWVQVHDVPVGYMSETLGHQLGDFIGKYVEYDPNNNVGGWRSYMKIRVLIDITKPLKRRKKIRKRGGESIMLTFKYERLPTFCFACGMLGHGERFCPVVFDHPELMEQKGWGSWLRAPSRRTAPTAGERWLVNPADVQTVGCSSGNGGGNLGGIQGRNNSALKGMAVLISNDEGHDYRSKLRENVTYINPSQSGINMTFMTNKTADVNVMELEENDDMDLKDDRKRKKNGNAGELTISHQNKSTTVDEENMQRTARPVIQARREQ